MRGFIYKTIIISIIFIIGFEFTIGKRIDPIVQNLDKFSNEHGRKELVNKLRKEMRKGLTKEYMLNDDISVVDNVYIRNDLITDENKNYLTYCSRKVNYSQYKKN